MNPITNNRCCKGDLPLRCIVTFPLSSQAVFLHPSCGLNTKPEWVLFNEFVITTRPFIRTVTEIRAEWLLELGPDYYDLVSFPNDEAKKALRRVWKRQRRMNSKASGSNRQ
jgi:pre-mRNA-splicing factor ATP-dependent RNA helicase DHX15/PRP43